MKNQQLFDRISRELKGCLAYNKKDVTPADGDTYFGLPRPYSVPTPGDCFHEMYYWDTYFTNVGLLAIGEREQAENNAVDIMALIDRFGFMPNGSRKRYLKHSQPPFFAEMVREIVGDDPMADAAFAKNAYAALCREHAYFKENRTFQNGLAHYGFLPTDADTVASRMGHWKRRTGIEADPDPAAEVGNYIAYCESGWDCNPRLETHAYLYAPPDLNALLWNLEDMLARLSALFEPEATAAWQTAADRRRQMTFDTLWSAADGCFLDRHMKTGAFSPVFSVASFYPLYFGMATEAQAAATRQKLPLLERAWGVVACQTVETEGHFQWGAPCGWACLQWVAVRSLLRYGFDADALRIAKKYVDLVEAVEMRTGQLWEKYNVETGQADEGAEYQTPPMLGWTAGVYLKCKLLLEEKEGENT